MSHPVYKEIKNRSEDFSRKILGFETNRGKQRIPLKAERQAKTFRKVLQWLRKSCRS